MKYTEHISYEVAKKLQEIGFPQNGKQSGWFAVKYYKNPSQGEWFEGEYSSNTDPYMEPEHYLAGYLVSEGIFISAPTYAETIDWFAGKGILINIEMLYWGNPTDGYDYKYAWFLEGPNIKKITTSEGTVKDFIEAADAAIIKASDFLHERE